MKLSERDQSSSWCSLARADGLSAASDKLCGGREQAHLSGVQAARNDEVSTSGQSVSSARTSARSQYQRPHSEALQKLEIERVEGKPAGVGFQGVQEREMRDASLVGNAMEILRSDGGVSKNNPALDRCSGYRQLEVRGRTAGRLSECRAGAGWCKA